MIFKVPPNTGYLDFLFNSVLCRTTEIASKLPVTGLCEGGSPATSRFPSQKASAVAHIFRGVSCDSVRNTALNWDCHSSRACWHLSTSLNQVTRVTLMDPTLHMSFSVSGVKFHRRTDFFDHRLFYSHSALSMQHPCDVDWHYMFEVNNMKQILRLSYVVCVFCEFPSVFIPRLKQGRLANSIMTEVNDRSSL